MKKMIFTRITEFDLSLPIYIVGVGCHYEQEAIQRPNGFPHFQWIQCRSGQGELILGQNRYLVNPGQGMLLFPNEPHEYYSIEESWIVDWVLFDGKILPSFFKDTAKIGSSGVYYLSHAQLMSDRISRIYDIEIKDSPMKNIEASRLAYEVVTDLLQFTSQKEDGSISHRKHRLSKVFAYIEEHYADAVDLEALAKLAGITPQHLCTIFKKASTQTITEYINLTRIQKSKTLLLMDKEKQIQEIAREVGYQDTSYYCSLFRKHVHMSPGEFRELIL